VARTAFYSQTDDPTATTIMQPLAPLKSKVTVVAGLDFKGMLDGGGQYAGHGAYPSMFTGTYKTRGPSIDQVVSTAVAKTVNLKKPLLNIAVAGGSASFREDGTSNTAETQVGRLFTTLFSSPGVAPAQVSAVLARRKSIIDYLKPELSTFAARRGSEDQRKISAHLDSIRQIETSLSATGGVSCTPVNPGAPTEYQMAMKGFSDVVALALRCDLTRAVSITWAADGGSGPGALPFLNIGANNGSGLGDVHAIAHQGPGGYAKKIVIDTWYIDQLAYLAKALDATIEGGGKTILDSSLIVMGNDMCESSLHLVAGLPFVLVGSAGGALKTGRTVKVGSWATASGDYWASGRTGVPHNQLLASISNLMDVPATSFGVGYPGTLTELA
jgi:hypothetical protein